MADIWTPLPLPFPIPLPYSGKGGDAQSGAKASAEGALQVPISSGSVSGQMCHTADPCWRSPLCSPREDGVLEKPCNPSGRGGKKHPALNLLIWSSFDETEKKLD